MLQSCGGRRSNPLGRKRLFCSRTEPGWDFFKLALTRTPDPIRPTTRIMTLPDPRTAAKEGVMT